MRERGREGSCTKWQLFLCTASRRSVGSRNDGVVVVLIFELPGKEKQRKDNPTPPKNDVFVCL